MGATQPTALQKELPAGYPFTDYEGVRRSLTMPLPIYIVHPAGGELDGYSAESCVLISMYGLGSTEREAVDDLLSKFVERHPTLVPSLMVMENR